MGNEYLENASNLRQNIKVLNQTFEKVGLEVLNVGATYANMLGGKGIKFFCEVIANQPLEDNKWYYIKINVYDHNDGLISMGSTGFILNQFSGYDTLEVCVFDESLYDNAASAKVFLTY